MNERDILAAQNGDIDVYQFTATGTLAVYQTRVKVTAGAADLVLTLPNVTEARGRIYTIELVATGGGGVTVQDQDETTDPYTSTKITGADGYCVVYSDGTRWYELAHSAT